MRLWFRPILVDVLLAAVLTGLTLATLSSQTRGRLDWLAAVLASLSVAPIALRQRAPIPTMVVISAALAASSLIGYPDPPSHGVGILVAMFTVATLRPRGLAAVMFAMAVGVIAFASLTMRNEAAWSELAQDVLEVLGAWVLGESTRSWGQHTERLTAKAARAAADERLRIARELHDIVAHHMSVISLQAGLADYVLDHDLATAKEAIAVVGDASRDVMLDLRRMLDVLRVDRGEELNYQPQPGLAVLDELVARIHSAGLAVEVGVTGRVRPLHSGPDLCAYRVVQESLTNVLKHAGPAEARIDIDYGEHTLTVKVTDNGTKAKVHQVEQDLESPIRHGIRGMRERAELYGGVLLAGPAEEGGFKVLLRLPLEDGR